MTDISNSLSPIDSLSVDVLTDDVSDAYVSRPGKLKATSKHAIERHVRTTFLAWASKPIVSITEDMCKARYRELLTKGLRGKKGAPGQANQAFAVLGALINYAGRQHKRADGSPLVLHMATQSSSIERQFDENPSIVDWTKGGLFFSASP